MPASVAAQASAPAPTFAPSPRGIVLDAARPIADIEIDGVIGEAEWEGGQLFSGFTQREPVEGDPAEYDTEVRVLLGDGAIWIGARMWDRSPAGIDTRLTRRDGSRGTYDQFGIVVDPNLDGLTGYGFSVSAANVQSDMYLYEDDRVDQAWDAVWLSAVSIDDRGWTAELRIPLSQIRYEASDEPQTWGIGFHRFRVANNERTFKPLLSGLRTGMVSQLGRIENLLVSRSARRLEVLPYALSSLHRGPSADGDPFFDGTAANGRMGLDLSYGLGAAFTLDATINPDFGQVEADPAVINLSAFETFFEERRPFFVEDARVFDFSLSGGRNQLFYTRRVGRSPQGRTPSNTAHSDVPENATILGAAKLAGRTSNGFSIGALVAVTGDEHGRALFDDGSTGDFLVEPRSEYGTMSVARDFREGASQVGVLGTVMRRELPGDGSFDWLPSSAYSGGVRFNHQWNDRDWAVFGYVSGSHVRGPEAALTRIQRSSIHYFQRPDATRFAVDANATSMSGRDWRVTFAKQNGEHWTGSMWAAEVTKGFEVNDVGFTTRSEVLDGGAALSYREIRPGAYLRSYNIGVRTIQNWSHEALDDMWSADSWQRARTGGSYNLSVNAQLLNYWGIGTSVSYRPQQMSRRQTRGGPMMVAPAATSLSFNFNSDRRKTVSVGLGLGISDDRLGDGGSKSLFASVTFQPSDNVAVTIGPQYNTSHSGDQYVTATGTVPYGPTYGTRYLFADLEQREFAMDARVDWTFTPTLSLQLYAQPLVSSGDYVQYKQLAASEAYDFLDLTPTYVAGTQEVDFDNDGTSDFTFTDRDFNVRSLIGNVVLRWEYRPGSTVFLVWQRRQSDLASVGDFDFGRDTGALFGAPADDRFIVKVNYWLGL